LHAHCSMTCLEEVVGQYDSMCFYDLQRLMLAVKGKDSPLNGIDISRYPVKHDLTTAVPNCKLVVLIFKSYRYTGLEDMTSEPIWRSVCGVSK
jgi:hypothetical protein